MISNELPPPLRHIKETTLCDSSNKGNQCWENVNERIQYVDAIRGVTMLIVVFQHIRAFSFGLYEDDSILSMVYLSFMLPMFFFISGFASYKKANSSIFVKIIEKFRQLVIPTIVFLFLHNYFPSYQERWGFPGGYWFTYSLFWITTIYLILTKPIQRISNRKFFIILLGISLLFVFLRGYFGSLLDSGWPTYLTTRKIFTYFIFFIIGAGCRHYIHKINDLFGKIWCRNILIILFLVIFTASVYISKTLPPAINAIFELFKDIISTVLFFMLFNITRKWWADKNHAVSRWLCFVGRRTLDLYMLHYFFLPNLIKYGFFFHSTGNCVIELAVVGVLTILVTIVSLSVGQLIRLSPYLSYWILGTRR